MHLETATLVWILFGAVVFIILSAFTGDHHVDVGGDVGHGGMDAGSGTHHGVTTSELFSIRNIALLAAGFSGASIIARNADVGVIGTNIAGICGAFIMVAGGIWLFRVVRRQESNSIISNVSLVGKTAMVTTTIPEDGYGEVALGNDHGVSVSLTARSSDGSMIRTGAQVKIAAVAGNIATVNQAS